MIDETPKTKSRTTRVFIDPKTIIDRNILQPPSDYAHADLVKSRSWPIEDGPWE